MSLSRYLELRVVLVAVVALMAASAPWSQAALAQTQGGFPDLTVGWELEFEGDFADSGRFIVASLAGTPGQGYVATRPLGQDVTEILFSVDGVDWEPAAEVGRSGTVNDVAAGPHGFVAAYVGPSSSAAYSADGRVWDRVRFDGLVLNPEVFAGPDGFVLVGAKASDTCIADVWASPDGRDWVSSNLPGGESCRGLVVGAHEGRWLGVALVAGETSMVKSEDGVDWTDLAADAPPPAVPKAWYLGVDGKASLVSDGSTLVLAGHRTEGIWVSDDGGSTWQQVPLVLGTSGIELASMDQGFVGVSFGLSSGQLTGRPSTVLFSADGVNWSEHPVSMDFFDIAVTDDGFIALATNGIYKWTRSPESLPQTGYTGVMAPLVGSALILGGSLILLMRRRSTSG